MLHAAVLCIILTLGWSSECPVVVKPTTARIPKSNVTLNLEGGSILASTRISGTTGKLDVPKYLVSFHKNNDDNVPFCTGSLISSSWVLTAASCGVTSGQAVRIGGSVAKSGVFRNISEVITHEAYDDSQMAVSAVLANDIAAVKLTEPAPATAEFILLNSNASVPSPDYYARVIGYGVSAPGARNQGAARSVDIPVVSTENCEEKFEATLSKGASESFRLEDDAQFCAGFSELNCDACPGDNGGPLMVLDSSNRAVQVGVTSFGVSCGTKKRPGVYTRVSAYLPWFRQKRVLFNTSSSGRMHEGEFQPEETLPLLEPICFPEDGTVILRNGSAKRMRDVDVGDEVACGGGEFSSVFMFTHRVATGSYPFVSIRHSASNRPITLSHSHYLYLNQALQPAKDAKIDDMVELLDGDIARIVKVESTVKRGLYNPQTKCGSIVVDGVRASTYTSAVPPLLAHGLLRPLAALHRVLRIDATCGAFERLNLKFSGWT